MIGKRTLRALISTTTLAAAAVAGDIQLSEFLGGASGGAVNASNPPFMTIVNNADFGGFGVDSAGGFSSDPIEYMDAGPFLRGIGAHPSSEIDFHLAAFATFPTFDLFTARVGITTTPTANQGATFRVEVDGVELLNTSVAGVDAASQLVCVRIEPIDETLTLITSADSVNGNHAAWADARLTTAPMIGDLNCDGSVSVGDIGAFVAALTDLNGYETTFPDCLACAADVNGDGVITVGDIGPFVSLLIS